jgi:hypothetical protein
MSWGYWGVVTVLVILSGVLLFGVALVYAGAHYVRRALGVPTEGPAEETKEPYRPAA